MALHGPNCFQWCRFERVVFMMPALPDVFMAMRCANDELMVRLLRKWRKRLNGAGVGYWFDPEESFHGLKANSCRCFDVDLKRRRMNSRLRSSKDSIA